MTTAPPTIPDNLRKAAILVRSLDADAVATLLARMPSADARAIRQAVRDLDQVSEEERALVADELRAGTQPSSGVELAFHQPAPGVTEDTYDQPSGPSAAPKLLQADAETLIAYLRLEQPATVAVVLSCLPAERAGQVLDGLPTELQTTAIDRLSALGDIDPDSLQVITTEIETWIARYTQDKRRQADRRAMVQAILRSSSAATQSRFVKQLPPVVKPVAPPVPATAQPVARAPVAKPQPAPPAISLPFSKLATLPAAVLAEVIRQVDASTLIVSLVGCEEALMNRLKSLSNRKQFRVLEKSIAGVGPVRLSDIELARTRLGQAAARVIGMKGAA